MEGGISCLVGRLHPTVLPSSLPGPQALGGWSSRGRSENMSCLVCPMLAELPADPDTPLLGRGVCPRQGTGYPPPPPSLSPSSRLIWEPDGKRSLGWAGLKHPLCSADTCPVLTEPQRFPSDRRIQELQSCCFLPGRRSQGPQGCLQAQMKQPAQSSAQPCSVWPPQIPSNTDTALGSLTASSSPCSHGHCQTCPRALLCSNRKDVE